MRFSRGFSGSRFSDALHIAKPFNQARQQQILQEVLPLLVHVCTDPMCRERRPETWSSVSHAEAWATDLPDPYPLTFQREWRQPQPRMITLTHGATRLFGTPHPEYGEKIPAVAGAVSYCERSRNAFVIRQVLPVSTGSFRRQPRALKATSASTPLPTIIRFRGSPSALWS